MLRRRRGSKGTQWRRSITTSRCTPCSAGCSSPSSPTTRSARACSARRVVQQQFRRPDATITMKLVAGEDREVITGKTDLRPEVCS